MNFTERVVLLLTWVGRCFVLILKFIGFVFKWMAIGWALSTVMFVRKPSKYDLLTKSILGVGAFRLAKRAFQPKKARKPSLAGWRSYG